MKDINNCPICGATPDYEFEGDFAQVFCRCGLVVAETAGLMIIDDSLGDLAVSQWNHLGELDLISMLRKIYDDDLVDVDSDSMGDAVFDSLTRISVAAGVKG